ncbi:MAG TPA: hypothetical protein K8U77_09950 [Slackia equolifaciens]|uniref:Uncharacterized protein n=1 Tax=Slackia equolifaciens TaxID=498718 RepID=A0A9D3A1J5_9ACTN|nr:hypothetical protein [Slackia equolifaciens]
MRLFFCIIARDPASYAGIGLFLKTVDSLLPGMDHGGRNRSRATEVDSLLPGPGAPEAERADDETWACWSALMPEGG